MGRSSPSSEDKLRKPQKAFTALGLIIAFILTYFAHDYNGVQFVLILWTGILIGFTLFHARFGFAAVYRQIVESGNTEMLRAHMVMLGTASTLFAIILIFDIGFFGSHPLPSVSEISIGLLVGSFLFGFGLEMGSGLAPASLHKAEGGRVAMLFTLFGFMTGSVIGVSHFEYWNEELPYASSFSLALDTGLGYLGAWGLQLGIFILIIICSYMYKKQKRPPALPSLPSASSWKRIIFGSWPIGVGAVLIAVFNAVVFVLHGDPWELTAAFAIWGSKLAMFFGLDVTQWGYWSSQGHLDALHQPVLMNSTSVLNIGVILGTFITMALTGLIRFAKAPLFILGIALLGGLLMGYGAAISYGANIGAYFSGIASFSLHAWIWTVMAITGVYTAFHIEKRLKLTRAGSKGQG